MADVQTKVQDSIEYILTVLQYGELRTEYEGTYLPSEWILFRRDFSGEKVEKEDAFPVLRTLDHASVEMSWASYIVCFNRVVQQIQKKLKKNYDSWSKRMDQVVTT